MICKTHGMQMGRKCDKCRALAKDLVVEAARDVVSTQIHHTPTPQSLDRLTAALEVLDECS